MSPEVLIEAEMQILLDWSFDVLQYDIEQLVHMAVNVFDFFHLTENFGIARTTLRAFITTVLPQLRLPSAQRSPHSAVTSIHLRGSLSLTPSPTHSLACDGGR
jgi:hypothetical protein